MTDSSATTRPAAAWEDFVDIFVSPAKVFARRQGSGFFVPLLVLLIGMLVLFFATRDALQPIFDAEYARGAAAMLKQNPQLTPEQVEQGRGTMAKFAVVGVVGFMAVAPLLAGLVLWLMGKIVGARQALGDAVMVGVFAFYPRLIEAALNAVQAFVLPEEQLRGRYSLSLGPARFLDPDSASPLLLALLGRVDLFTLWVTALLAIGLRVTGKITTAQAVLAAALVWLIGALPGLLGALRAAG